MTSLHDFVDARLVALIVLSARNAFATIGLRLPCAPS